MRHVGIAQMIPRVASNRRTRTWGTCYARAGV